MDIILKIKSIFQKDGTAEANKEVDNLTTATDKAVQKNTEAKAASIGASQGISLMSSAAGAASGNMGSAASAVGQLVSKLPALSSVAGPISLAAAAVVALSKAWSNYKDMKAEASEASEQMATEKEIANIERIKKAYDEATIRIAAAADAIDRFYAADQSRDDTQMQKQLAELELSFAQKRAAMDPNDKFASRRLEVDRTTARADIMESSEARRLQRQLDEIQAKGATVADSVQKEKILQSANTSKISDLFKVRSQVYEGGMERADDVGWWDQAKKADIFDKTNKSMDKLTEQIEKLKNEIQQSKDKEQQGDRNLFTMSEQARTLLIRQNEILPIENKTAATERSIKTTEINRDVSVAEENQRKKLMNDRINELKREASNRSSVADGLAKGYDSDDFKSSGKTAHQRAQRIDKQLDDKAALAKRIIQELADIERKADALPLEQLGQQTNRINSRLNRLETALRNLPNN